jgi:hypothetical protein
MHCYGHGGEKCYSSKDDVVELHLGCLMTELVDGKLKRMAGGLIYCCIHNLEMILPNSRWKFRGIV